ncbi:hypothetical protein [Sulfurimonas sp.]|uniref:hypothetical protein n=1 Tax=Sulfurimonas sp. TaxID=2022749 RepID=UPI0019F8B9B8|nr:hypothetical protein [Sulfurimonas sp.]MBE0515479.1 hypothetical protein [Sulfurimonas sp.]
MYILIPMDNEDAQEASITKLGDVKIWAQVLVQEGRVAQIKFNPEWSTFEDRSEAAVVMDDNEYVWPFMEQNMMVLVAHTQRSIDDIVEAYIFRELNELAY